MEYSPSSDHRTICKQNAVYQSPYKIGTAPDPYDTLEQLHCFYHYDLPDMTLAELELERIKVQMSLSMTARPAPWFAERVQRLEEEIEHIRSLQDSFHLDLVRHRDGQRWANAHGGIIHPLSGRSGPPLSEREVIRRMLSGTNGAHTRALWHGDISAYCDYSEAKAALLNQLWWWCQGDANQVNRIFRQSGLYRHHHRTS